MTDNYLDLHNEFLDQEYRKKNYVTYYIESVTNPYMVTVQNVNQKGCLQWIEKNLSDRINKKSYHRYSDNPEYEEISYLIDGNIFIHIHSSLFVDIMFFELQLEKTVNEIASELEKYKL